MTPQLQYQNQYQRRNPNNIQREQYNNQYEYQNTPNNQSRMTPKQQQYQYKMEIQNMTKD